MSKILEKAEELLEEIKAVKKTRKLNAQERSTESRLIYHLRSAGVHSVKKGVKGSTGSQLNKRFSQKAKENVKPLEHLEEGENKLKKSKKLNEEAKADPKQVEENLELAELEAEADLDAAEVEEIVLANSEEKPKPKTRGRKKKTD